MGRSLFVIKSLIFSRYYSNSINYNYNSETEEIYTSNHLDKDQNIIVYINVHSLKKRILQDNKGFIITMKGTYEKSFERFNSTKVQNSSIPSLSSKPNKFKMHP